MSPRLSAPNRDPAAVSEKERREMRQESDAELLKVRATGNECKKRAGSRGASASRRRPQCADREMDGCRLDYCARRLDYYHCRIRPLGRASDFLTLPRVFLTALPMQERRVLGKPVRPVVTFFEPRADKMKGERTADD
jgi:hypothetical protein